MVVELIEKIVDLEDIKLGFLQILVPPDGSRDQTSSPNKQSRPRPLEGRFGTLNPSPVLSSDEWLVKTPLGLIVGQGGGVTVLP